LQQGSNGQREYQYLCRIGEGSFWNIRGRFTVVGGLLNIGTHMSVAQRINGRFIVIDTITLPPPALAELKHLTQNGDLIDAVIATHPYHTLAFPAFFKEFPKAAYYGTPRHLSVMPEIPWQGEVMAMKETFAPDLECRIPAGAEYVLPLPARTNHLSNVFVLHKQSKTIHNDDCILCIERPPIFMKLLGFRNGDMLFHPSIKGPGLYPTKEAPADFRDFVNSLIEDWDFDHLCSAHNGNCISGAKEKLRDTLAKAEPILRKLIAKTARENVSRTAARGLPTIASHQSVGNHHRVKAPPRRPKWHHSGHYRSSRVGADEGKRFIERIALRDVANIPLGNKPHARGTIAQQIASENRNSL